MNKISSRQNQEIKYLIKLTNSSSFRFKQKKYVVEGIHLLQCAPVDAIISLFIAESKLNHPEIEAILLRLKPLNVFCLTDSLLNSISSLTRSQEPIAIVKMPEFEKIEEIKEDCILLEKIQDPGNIGTIIRSAVAGGIRHLLLSYDCADVFMPKVLRASMGAIFQMNVYPNTNLLDFVKEYPYNILLTTLDKNSVNLYKTDLTSKNAWIVGNEGRGVETDFRALKPDIKKIHIPMIGGTESLNVSTAISVCIFEQLRQRLDIFN